MLSALAVLAGCSDLRQTLGLERAAAPDEFAVVTAAPLALPPDFSLRPPDPGAPRPQEISTTEQARALVVGESATSGEGEGEGEADALASVGQQALLAGAGASNVDPEIRDTVDRETRVLIDESGRLADVLLFWRTEAPLGVIVDPVGEAQRLREAEAAGLPVTAGETPTIERSASTVTIF